MGHTTSISEYELARGDGPPPCDCVDVEEPAAKETKTKSNKPKSKKAAPEVEEVDVEALTIPELQAQLDELGVEYSGSDRKADLQEKLYDALG